MPPCSFKSVYRVSSEDSAHPAENLLKIQPGKKWKCREVSEKSAHVILQLSNPQRITGIDIGNEHSAFAQVSVGKFTCDRDEFQEILTTSSFMTPIESKNSTNVNRVRCFTANALVESVAKEKWDLIKVTCTQPFNRHVQYGLSFITIHGASTMAPSNEIDTNMPVPTTSKAGMLQLREDSPETEDETNNTLFNRWKQSREDPMSGAAAIRAASSPAALKENSSSLKPTKVDIGGKHSTIQDKNCATTKFLDRNRDGLLFDKDDAAENDRLERKISKDKLRLQLENKAADERKKKHSQSSIKQKDSQADEVPKGTPGKITKNKIDLSVTEKSKHHDRDPQTNGKRLSSSASISPEPPTKKLKQVKEVEYRPFNRLLRDVVLVISGIQNPDRGAIRQKAVELGAKYKPDWDHTCTHLICAFKNTPKYNQVRGKGKIITRQWIEKCHSLKKRIPWRRFALDDREAEKSESEDEIYDLSLKPHGSKNMDTELRVDSKRTNACLEPVEQNSKRNIETSEQVESSDDIPADYYENDNRNHLVSSGSDTDEDIERIVRNQDTKNEKKDHQSPRNPASTATKCVPTKTMQETKIVYELSTDEDESTKAAKASTSNPKIFDGMKFSLSGTLQAADLVKLKEYIRQFKGQLVEDISKADYLIAKDKAEITEGFRGEIVSPLWVFECYDMECRIPTRRYLLTNTDRFAGR